MIYSSFSETHELLNSFIAGFWVFLGLSTIILVLGCPTKYTLTDKGLRIHTGIFLSWKIPYDRIIDAYPVYSISGLFGTVNSNDLGESTIDNAIS